MPALEIPDLSNLLVRRNDDDDDDDDDDDVSVNAGSGGGDANHEQDDHAGGAKRRHRDGDARDTPATSGARTAGGVAKDASDGSGSVRRASAWTEESIALLHHAHAQMPRAWKAIHQRYFADRFTYHQVKCKGAYLFCDRHRRKRRPPSTPPAPAVAAGADDARSACADEGIAAPEPAAPPALLAFEPPPRRTVSTRGGRRHTHAATARRKHTRFTVPVAAGSLRIPNVGPPVMSGDGGRASKRPRRHRFYSDTVRGARDIAAVRPVNVAGMSVSVCDAFMGDGADAARVSLVNCLQRTMCSFAVPALDYHHCRRRHHSHRDPRIAAGSGDGGPARLELLFSDWYLPPADIDYLLGRLELHTDGGDGGGGGGGGGDSDSSAAPALTTARPMCPPRRNHHRFRPPAGPSAAPAPAPAPGPAAGTRVGRYTMRAPANAQELRALLEHICIDYRPLPLRDDVFAAILGARSPQFAAHVPALAQSIVLSPEGNYVRVDIRQRLAETWARYVRWRDELWHTNLRAHMTMHVYLDSLRRTRRTRGHAFRILRCVKHVIDSTGLTYDGMRRLCGGRRRARIERIMRHIEREEDGYGQYTCRHANAMFTAFLYDLIWGTLSVLHRVPADEIEIVDALELMGMDDAIEYYLGGKTRRLYNANRRRRRQRRTCGGDAGGDDHDDSSSCCSSSVYSSSVDDSSFGGSDIGHTDDLWDDLWGSDGSDAEDCSGGGGGGGSVVALDPDNDGSIDAWLTHGPPPTQRQQPPPPTPPATATAAAAANEADDWPDVDPRAVERVAGMAARDLRGPLLVGIFRAWAKSYVRRHHEQLEFSSDDIYKDFCRFLGERCGIDGRISTNQRSWRDLVGGVRAGRFDDMPLAAHPTIKRRFLAVRRTDTGDAK